MHLLWFSSSPMFPQSRSENGIHFVSAFPSSPVRHLREWCLVVIRPWTRFHDPYIDMYLFLVYWCTDSTITGFAIQTSTNESVRLLNHCGHGHMTLFKATRKEKIDGESIETIHAHYIMIFSTTNLRLTPHPYS